MNQNLQQLETEAFTVEREWTVDGIPVLTASLSVPRPAGRTGRTARRIDRFYQLQCRTYLRYCEKLLFPKVAAEYQQALAGSAPLPHDIAVMSYQVTCSEHGIWSLYTDIRETIGGHTEVLRRGDSWNLHTGYPMPLSAFFPKRFPIRKKLLACAENEICRQEKAGLACYHDNYRQELRKHFNRENFYVQPDCLRFFWQMYAVAPSAEGIPVFAMPFSEDGCRWPEPGKE